MTFLEFLILDTDFNAVETVDVFESFIWTDRYSAFGDFELCLAPTRDNLLYLREDYFVWIGESDRLMVIENVEITSDVEDGARLLVSGRSLESILASKIVWEQTMLAGGFQDGVKKLLDENVINPAVSDRRIPNFIFQPSSDPRITGLTLNTQFTGGTLYDAVKKLCDTNNLGFKVMLDESNRFVFSLYCGTDRSYNQSTEPYVIFSPDFDNLLNSNYISSKRDFKTVALVAGEGEGNARKKVVVSLPSGGGTGLQRRELYVDARDISSNNGEVPAAKYLEMLTQRGLDKLSESAVVKTFDGRVDTQQNPKYGRDFFMGDIVQITNEYGLESTSRVTELIRSHDVDGYEEYPTFTTIG